MDLLSDIIAQRLTLTCQIETGTCEHVKLFTAMLHKTPTEQQQDQKKIVTTFLNSQLTSFPATAISKYLPILSC